MRKRWERHIDEMAFSKCTASTFNRFLARRNPAFLMKIKRDNYRAYQDRTRVNFVETREIAGHRRGDKGNWAKEIKKMKMLRSERESEGVKKRGAKKKCLKELIINFSFSKSIRARLTWGSSRCFANCFSLIPLSTVPFYSSFVSSFFLELGSIKWNVACIG